MNLQINLKHDEVEEFLAVVKAKDPNINWSQRNEVQFKNSGEYYRGISFMQNLILHIYSVSPAGQDKYNDPENNYIVICNNKDFGQEIRELWEIQQVTKDHEENNNSN